MLRERMKRHVRYGVLLVLLRAAPTTARHERPVEAPASAKPPVRAHLEFLASDALNGRGSGTRDEQIAAEYVGAHSGGSGLETGRRRRQLRADGRNDAADGDRQAVDHDRRREMDVRQGVRRRAPSVRRGDGPAAAASRARRPALRRGAIVFLAEDNQDWLAQLALAGAGGDSDAAEHGRRAVGRAGGADADGGHAHYRHPAGGAGPHHHRVAERRRRRELAAVADGTHVRIDTAAGEPQKTYTYNAVGILPGTGAAGEAILITSHLDHLGRRETIAGADKIYNGADDDASGTVAVMEIAEALAKKKTPYRTIIFACFGSEEVGGFGATYLREIRPSRSTRSWRTWSSR